MWSEMPDSVELLHTTTNLCKVPYYYTVMGGGAQLEL